MRSWFILQVINQNTVIRNLQREKLGYKSEIRLRVVDWHDERRRRKQGKVSLNAGQIKINETKYSA
jgi:hypothetical protein